MEISVVLAVWNGALYLAEALDSVLGQSRPPDEVIVVDDGSTDATPDILAGYGGAIRVLRQANGGQGAALAAGIAAARGALLAFQDADDIWPAERLAHQWAALAADPALDAVFGLSEQFVSPELDADLKRRLAPPRVLLVGEIATCILVRRAALDRFGGFAAGLSTAFFFEWLGRAKAGGLRARTLDEVVHRRRLHPANNGRVNAADRDRQLLATLRSHIARRRV